MPPLLALLICTVLVIFLLRVERKQSPDVSRALWIPTIWTLYIGSKPLAVWFNVTNNLGAGSAVDRNFLIGLFFLGQFILIKRNFSWSKVLTNYSWLALLITYMLISCIWSDMLYVSVKRWTKEFIAVTMAFVVLTEKDPKQSMICIFRRTTYILIPFSYVLINYFPDLGREYAHWSGKLMWVGVTLQKNSLGRLCLISSFFYIWTIIRRRRGLDIFAEKHQIYADTFILFLTFYLLKGPPGAHSATSVATLGLGLLTLYLFARMKRRGKFVGANTLSLIMIFIVLYGVATPFLGWLTLFDPSSNLGRDATLTGRTDIWEKLIPVAMQKPLLGHGFGGFWTPEARIEYASEAHNGYLEIILNTGFVGLFIVTTFLVSCCRKAQRVLVMDFEWGSLWICFLLMTSIHNITESSIDSFSSHLTATLAFLLVILTANNSSSQDS